mmetsp:Transcript_91932/g.286038  ORF Transcript_91932/g.286038 Transcript_91932/m.286038 type:complete len:292 (+) Transcript_91932:899-1774(+)
MPQFHVVKEVLLHELPEVAGGHDEPYAEETCTAHHSRLRVVQYGLDLIQVLSVGEREETVDVAGEAGGGDIAACIVNVQGVCVLCDLLCKILDRVYAHQAPEVAGADDLVLQHGAAIEEPPRGRLGLLGPPGPLGQPARRRGHGGYARLGFLLCLRHALTLRTLAEFALGIRLLAGVKVAPLGLLLPGVPHCLTARSTGATPGSSLAVIGIPLADACALPAGLTARRLLRLRLGARGHRRQSPLALRPVPDEGTLLLQGELCVGLLEIFEKLGLPLLGLHPRQVAHWEGHR